jgi:hypothetical protein
MRKLEIRPGFRRKITRIREQMPQKNNKHSWKEFKTNKTLREEPKQKHV